MRKFCITSMGRSPSFLCTEYGYTCNFLPCTLLPKNAHSIVGRAWATWCLWRLQCMSLLLIHRTPQEPHSCTEAPQVLLNLSPLIDLLHKFTMIYYIWLLAYLSIPGCFQSSSSFHFYMHAVAITCLAILMSWSAGNIDVLERYIWFIDSFLHACMAAAGSWWLHGHTCTAVFSSLSPVS